MGFFDGIVDTVSDFVGDISGGDLLKAGASFLGGASANQKSWDIAQATNAANAQQAQLTNQFNAQEAQKNRDYQSSQRETQYQTAVNDLMKAGLNPMLAYSQGGAKPTGGAQATGVQAQMQGSTVRDAITPAVATALQSSQNAADIALKKEQSKATSAQTAKTNADAIKTIADTAKSEQDTKTSAAAEAVNREQLNKIAQDIALSKVQATTSSAQGALHRAQEINVKENVAPSADPFWYRDIKKFGHSALQGWKEKVQQSNKYLK